MRLYLTFLLLSCTYLPFFAQAKKGLQYLEDRDYAAAYSAFQAAMNNPKDRLLASYGLSQVYSQKRYDNFNLDTAYAYILEVKTTMESLPEREQKSWERRLSMDDIKRQKSVVERKVVKLAEANQDLALYDHFLAHYQPSSQRRIDEATRKRNQLAARQALAQPGWKVLANRLQQYGQSMIEYSTPLWHDLQDSVIVRYFNEQTMEGYPAFAENFPQHPAVTEGWKTEADALAAAHDLGGSIAFIRRHARDAFGRYQFDRLTDIALGSNSEKDLREWLSIFRESDDRAAVYRHYYTVYFKTRHLPRDYQQFAAAHPDFPEPDRLQQDQQNARGNWARRLQQPDASLADFKAYFAAYPDEQNSALWERFTNLYLSGKPQTEATRQLLTDYPNHPQAADLRARQADEEKARLLQQTRPRSFVRYLTAKPESATDSDIQAAYYAAVIDWDQAVDRAKFLELVQTGPYRQKMLDVELGLAAKKGDLQAVNAFGKRYPDYENKTKLKEAKQTASENVSLDQLLLQDYSPDLKTTYDQLIRKNVPNDMAYELLRKMLDADIQAGKYDAAYAVLKSYRSLFRQKSSKFNQLESALRPLERAATPPRSISDKINSPGSEYHSILSVDGQTLYFCGTNRPGNLSTDNEDVFVAQKVDGLWQAPTLVGDLSSEGENDSPFGLSADGTEMILFQTGRLGTAKKTKDGWTEFQAFGKQVNIRNWQSYGRFSADGQALMFVARRDDPDGDTDIWVCERQADGSWGKAINMGSVINTSGNERSPFLHPDMKTLYFSSDTHQGLGSQDVFMSKRLDDSWTKWSEPVNLGRAINTAAREWDLKVSTDGSYGYFAKTMPGQLHSDIVIVDLPESARPEEVLVIKGRVVDINEQPVGATILWQNLSGGASIQQTEADPRNGRFIATLPTKTILQVGYSINEAGYFPASGVIEVQPGETEIVLDFPLQLTSVEDIRKNKLNLPIDNLFFDTNKYNIKKTSYPGLDRVAAFLLENNLCVEIAGHSDSLGDEADNLRLSENRANAVRDYLLQKGIPAACLQASGYGASEPVADNKTSRGRAKNRRVEIRVR